LAIVCALAGFIVPSIVSAVAKAAFPSMSEPVAEDAAIPMLLAAIALDLLYLGALLVPPLLAIRFAVAGRRAQKELNVEIMQRRSLQSRHDILEAVRAGSTPPPFFLYLRPFYSDELFIDNPGISSLPFLPSHYHAPAVSWESVFADRVETFGPFVSLGRTSDTLGADRIESTDEDWVSEFVLLASFAECIFVWPSTRPGTRWEIKWLLDQGLLVKCIFVVASGYDDFIEATNESWDYVRAFLFTLELSPPVPSGMLFPPAWPVLTRRLKISRRAHCRRAIGDLLAAARTRESVTERSARWRSADDALRKTPPVPEPKELDIVLPCVQCGRALTEIACVHCDPESEAMWRDRQFLRLFNVQPQAAS
jgi:hypothetical protein